MIQAPLASRFKSNITKIEELWQQIVIEAQELRRQHFFPVRPLPTKLHTLRQFDPHRHFSTSVLMQQACPRRLQSLISVLAALIKQDKTLSLRIEQWGLECREHCAKLWNGNVFMSRLSLEVVFFLMKITITMMHFSKHSKVLITSY